MDPNPKIDVPTRNRENTEAQREGEIGAMLAHPGIPEHLQRFIKGIFLRTLGESRR